MEQNTKYLVAGDSALLVEFGNEIAPAINEKVRAMFLAVEGMEESGILALTPTYRSLLIQYDPVRISYAALLEKLQALEGSLASSALPKPNVLEIPTLYGGEEGPDLEFVSEHSGLSREEVIRIHSSEEYLIYMLGFAPGFPYLGGMDPRLATPRLKAPRQKIEAGSVGIAGQQTGIYPIASPGGWQLIGRTPIKLYDPKREKPILYGTGDYLKFVPITKKEFEEIGKAVETGTYQYVLREKR